MLESPKKDQSRLFPCFPNTIGEQIIGYLPAYQRTGKRSLSLINKRWAEYITPTIPTALEIVKSCTSKEDALNILSHESIYSQLNFTQFLEVVAFHPELVKCILKDNINTIGKTHGLLSIRDAMILASKNEEFGLELLKRPINEYIWEYWIADLATKHLSLAKFILNQPHLRRFIVKKDIIKLCEKDSESSSLVIDLAKRENLPFAEFVTDPELADKLFNDGDNELDAHSLDCLGGRFAHIAKVIIDTPRLVDKLGENWAHMGNNHPFVAQFLAEHPHIVNKLNKQTIYDIALKHPGFAQSLSNEHLKRLSHDMAGQIALIYPCIAQQIVNDKPYFAEMVNAIHHLEKDSVLPKLIIKYEFVAWSLAELAMQQHNDEDIFFQARFAKLIFQAGFAHLVVARFIFNTETLLKKIEQFKSLDYVLRILSQYEELADEYLTNHPRLNLVEQAKICAPFPTLATILFTEQSTNLPPEGLTILAVKHKFIADAIKDEPYLRGRLNAWQLLDIISAHSQADWALQDIEALPPVEDVSWHSKKNIYMGKLTDKLLDSDWSYKAAQTILSHKRFYQHLNSRGLWNIFKKYPTLLPMLNANSNLHNISNRNWFKHIKFDSISLKLNSQLIRTELYCRYQCMKKREETKAITFLTRMINEKAKALLLESKIKELESLQNCGSAKPKMT